jgi:hypothetical protein
MQDREKILTTASESLRTVVSVRDFLTAVQVGAETAIGMLDDIESKLLAVVKAINEDFDR